MCQQRLGVSALEASAGASQLATFRFLLICGSFSYRGGVITCGLCFLFWQLLHLLHCSCPAFCQWPNFHCNDCHWATTLSRSCSCFPVFSSLTPYSSQQPNQAKRTPAKPGNVRRATRPRRQRRGVAPLPAAPPVVAAPRRGHSSGAGRAAAAPPTRTCRPGYRSSTTAAVGRRRDRTRAAAATNPTGTKRPQSRGL